MSADDPPDAPTDPVEVVRAFLAALERLDVDGALELTRPTSCTRTCRSPPPGDGRRSSSRSGSSSATARGSRPRCTRSPPTGRACSPSAPTCSSGDLRAGFWVDGTFEVVDGRITVWRDRFDWATVVAGARRGAAGDPRRLGGAPAG